ncbi:MAG: hypothetical protein J6Y29_05965 [Clostridiales bacterium]|nr:hypothetical protein [Clostridiales bacterium]
MAIDARIYIAFKCDQCDHVQMCKLSIFRIFCGGSDIRCQCGESGLRIININKIKLKIAFYCPKCDEVHSFLLLKREIMREDVLVLYCPYADIPLCVIGKNAEDVLREVDLIEEKIENLVDTRYNLRGYFTNSKVMYESIDKINNILRSGQIVCKCGSGDIAVYVKKDKLVLKCRNCMAQKELKAATNKDLNDLLDKMEIFLDK